MVPAEKRLAYLPRTPSEKSYSGRMVDRRDTDLRDLFAFFICLSLAVTGGSSASDPDDVAALHMGDHYKMPSEGLADQEEMLLIEGMVRGLEW